MAGLAFIPTPYDDTYDSTYIGTQKCVKNFAKKSAKFFANESAKIFAKLGAKKFTQNLHLFYICKFCTLVCTSDHVKRPSGIFTLKHHHSYYITTSLMCLEKVAETTCDVLYIG